MASFEEAVRTRLRLATDSTEPPVNDLEYYARPENYSGAELSLQRFWFASRKHIPLRPHTAGLPRDNVTPIGAASRADDVTVAVPLFDNFVRDESETDSAKIEGRQRMRRRHGSVNITSQRGSIHLQIRSTSSATSGGSYRTADTARTRKESKSDRPEVVPPETARVTSHEARWREAVDRIRKPDAYVEHTSQDTSDTEVEHIQGVSKQ